MGWIVQQYDDAVHVVPDTEAGHVLEAECWCVPTIRQEADWGIPMVSHRDLLDRAVVHPDN